MNKPNDKETAQVTLEQLVGQVLETGAHHSRLLQDTELDEVSGARAQLQLMMAESTPSCSPCADDCQD